MNAPTGEGGDARAFPDLTGIVLPGRSFSDLLDVVVNLAVSAVEGITGASVSVVHRDTERLETSNATSADIRRVDEAQYDKGEGPCVEAIRTGTETTIEIPTRRWPEFSDSAAAAGVRSVQSYPLAVDGRTLGALNCYSTSETALAAAATRVVRDLASQAAVVLANATALAVAEMTNRQLQEALETRDLIGQAKGILMARQNIDADAAFDILRRASQRSNRKLRDIAAEILARAGDPDIGR